MELEENRADQLDIVRQCGGCRDEDALVAMLDGCVSAGESRIQIQVVEGQGEVIERRYHHGRCDVGSPWACGTAFDVPEDPEECGKK